MKNVQKIIDARGGLDALKHIRLEVGGYMPLVIERIGEGPNGFPLVSVCHYGEQNGDPMRDPEMTFEVAHGEWYPVSFRNDYVGADRVASFKGEDGKVYSRPQLQRELKSFARTWNKNIGDQGYLKAAKKRG